jgi:hypothetical protein
MKHEYSNKAPLMRLALAVAALSVTLSIGGFIDFLAAGHAMVANEHQATVLTAERKIH